MARAGNRVVGFEVDARRASELNEGRSYIPDVAADELAAVVGRGLLEGTTDFSRVAECDAIAICVPTPLDKAKEPDVTYMVAAAKSITPYLRPGMLVTLESTYPGTTEGPSCP
jgi:UDP-N-acetyl-D-glucosamine dehydrogenase